MSIQITNYICWYMLYFWNTRKKYLTYSLLMPRWHFRNRNHPGAGWDLSVECMAVNLVLICPCNFPGEPRTLPAVCAPRWQPHGGRWKDMPGTAPRAATHHGTPSCWILTQLTAAGDVLGLVWPCLLLPACLIVLSYAPACSCPVVPVPRGCVEFSIITIYSADAMQTSQWGWARWTQ